MHPHARVVLPNRPTFHFGRSSSRISYPPLSDHRTVPLYLAPLSRASYFEIPVSKTLTPSRPLSQTHTHTHAHQSWHPVASSPPLRRPSRTTASASSSPSPRPSSSLRSWPPSCSTSFADRLRFGSIYLSPFSAFPSPSACAPTTPCGHRTGRPPAWAPSRSPACAVAGRGISTSSSACSNRSRVGTSFRASQTSLRNMAAPLSTRGSSGMIR